MLSRPGSSTSSNLQRSKSNLSVKERRKHPLQAEPIDPQTARAHALIAAHRAVNRSWAQASTDLARSESLISSNSAPTHEEQSIKFSPASHLKRQRSTLQSRVPKLADTLQIPGTQSQRGQGDKPIGDRIEWGLSGETYGTEPSSYRRLKRSNSLLTPVRQLRRPNIGSPETSLSRATTLRTTDSSVMIPSPGLKVRLRRSFNFLRQSQSAPNRVITAPAQLQSQKPCSPEVLTLARSQYLEEVGQQHLQHLIKKPSILFSTKAKRAQKAFRKSFRAIEGNNDEGSLTDLGQVPCEKVAPKSVSASLGDKLRKIFTRSKPSDSLPPQQLKASRPHFQLDLNTPSPEAGFDSYLDIEPQVTGRNSLYTPSSLGPDISDDFDKLSQNLSQSGSCESLCSVSKSRVTSWTNSTTSGSVAGQALPYEPKRLSVIKEDGGPHQPSSSAGRHFGGVFGHPIPSPRHQFENVPALQQPLKIPSGQEVDSQRIYSALMKRLDDGQREMEQTEAAFRQLSVAREQDEVVSHYLFPASTIRRVRSKGSTSLTDIKEDDLQQYRDFSVQHRNQESQNADQQQIYIRKTRTESSHPKFVSPICAFSREDRTISKSSSLESFDEPRMQNDNQIAAGSDAETGSVIRKQVNIRGDLGDRKLGQSTDSIYSRTTNGGTNPDYISQIGSSETLEAHRDDEDKSNLPLHLQQSMSRFDRHPSSGDGLSSSGDTSRRTPQKGWTGHQMTSLEARKPHWRAFNHFREHAQIDPEDTDVGRNQYRSQQPRLDARNLPSQLSQPHVKSQRFLRASQDNSPSRLNRSPTSLLCLKEVPQKYTPEPRTNALIRRSQSALLNQIDSTLQPVTDVRKPTGLRKISSSNVAKILKGRKSQPALQKQQSSGKENDPISTSSSAPISTPGRYSVGIHDSDDTTRLRKGKSTIGFGYVDDRVRTEDHSPKLQHIPSDELRDVLSARLSKPFDMDIPDCNRPFDSTYLGKRESGSGNRLSVATTLPATRRLKTYGDLGPAPFAGGNGLKTYGNLGIAAYIDDETTGSARSEVSEPTALPPLAETNNAQRSASGLSLGLASKRIMGSFLRNRKTKEDNALSTSPAGSPAFI